MTDFKLQDVPPISPLVNELLSLSLDDADAEQRLHTIVASEPKLSIRLVAVANSVACRGCGPELSDSLHAIRRIGLARTRQLAIGMLFSQPLTRRLPGRLAYDIWLHSLTMAAAAQEIARIKGHPEPGTAYLLGLVHDLGYLMEELAAPGSLAANVTYALANNVAPEEAERRQLGACHADLAAALLEHWGAPAGFAEALAVHHDDDLDPDSLAAAVYGAEKLARFSEVTDVLYEGRDHLFAPLSLDRLGLEFLFAQQLELGEAELGVAAERIIEQVEGFQATASAMDGVH